MKADKNFNKRAAPQVNSNWTEAKFSPFKDHAITVRVYGSPDDGDWNLSMNALEAHRLLSQLSDALASWAKHQLAQSTKGNP